MMSHSITFHSVYFELSTVPRRETMKGVDFYSLFSLFPVSTLISEKKIAINRNKSIISIAIFSHMKKIDLNGSILRNEDTS